MDVPEQQPHRRRRQAIESEPQEPPRRIVIAQDEEPDWLVSADHTTGAASRRNKQAQPAKQAEPARQTEAQERPVRRTEPAQERPARRTEPVGRTEPKGARETAARTGARTAQTRTMVKRPTKKKKTSKKARARRMRTLRRSAVGVLAAALVIVLVIVGARAGGRLMDIKRTLDRGDGVFYPNIFVNDIPLEGRTLDEAAALVSRQVSDLISSWRITLRTQDGRSWDITGEDLGMQYDVADQLDQLWAIGHSGTSSQRYEQVKTLTGEPVRRYTTLSYDMSSINQILSQIKSEVDRPAVSATKVYDETVWPPYTYTDDVDGQELDITGLNEKIMGMVDRLESGVVDLAPTPVKAPVTRAYLESQIVKLSSFETAIGNTSTEGRFYNIQKGTEEFNHLIIKSGESVSFNKVTGKRTEANGYQQALELAYGEYVMGWGGGICQVSSTLYNAVVNAGLEVRSRTQHSRPSSYVDKGLDATVQDDRLDFVFKNSTNADIFIESEYYKKGSYYRCKFTIYGRPDPNGYTYRLESQVVQTIEKPEPVIKPDKDMKYVVYDDETYEYSKGEDGYVVDVYLVTMDANGLEVSREKKYTDTYKAAAPVTYVGVTPRETPVPFDMPGAID